MAKKKRKPGRPATGQAPKRWLGRVHDEPWQTIKDGGAEAEKQTGKNFTQWAVGLLLKEARKLLTAARRKRNREG